jgi:hypothetical protein
MKFTFSLLAILSLMCLHAQDTLVDKNGLATVVKIIEVDSSFISYYGSDTSSNEAILAPISNFILIKQGNNVLSSYTNDTLISKTGKIVTCKVLSIEPGVISYFKYTDHILPIQVLSKDNLLLIKLSDGTSEIPKDEIVNTNIPNAFQLGEEDAKKYYKPGGGMIAGEVLLGFTHLLMASTVAGTVIAYVPPTKLSSENNPNNFLLSTDPTYKNGYLSVAKKKKQARCSAGFLSGLAAFWAAILISIDYW